MSIRLANLAGRAALLVGDGTIDVARASGGRFSVRPDGGARRVGRLRRVGARLDARPT